jgi:flagellar hook-length control protein FliK
MILKNGGEGILRLVLKPDVLGNVKIHLKMSENNITGYIIVESEEALSAFKKEIVALQQAFMEAGFSSADLELSMAADDRNTEWNEQDENSFIPRMIASRYDDQSLRGIEQEALLIDIFSGRRLNTFNMFA